ncbi:MAG: fibronectin type III domain-containing protein [Verrucomicrobia bacterium]|nr:fibronectin type III domain-containing protein [Verrucomicrobiota bacterium]
MPKYKLELQKQSILERIDFGKQFTAKMTGNANFPNLTTETSDLSDATAALESTNKDADAALKTYQEKLTIRDNAVVTFDAAANTLAAGVQKDSRGDEAKIQSAGLSLKSPRSPIGPMSQAQNLSATASDQDGTIDLGWDRVRGAKSYEVQRSADPTNGWAHVCSCTRSNVTVNSMTSGTRYWFRVAAIGSAGPGPWSDPAMKIAP